MFVLTYPVPVFISVKDMDVGSTNTSQLTPTVVVPIAAEVILDLTVSDYTISLMIVIASKNLFEDDVSFDFDVDLREFIDQFHLDTVFTNLTSLLDTIAGYGPTVTAGADPTAIHGLFNVVNEAADFAGSLEQFTSLVQNGEISVPRFPIEFCWNHT